MKITKRLLIISFLVTTLFCIYCFTPTRLTSKQQLSKDDISVIVHPGGNTGPRYVIEDKDKLWNTIKDKYPDANPGYIILTGNTPYKFVNDPSILGNFVVHGKVSGTFTDPYDGVIPIFDVVYSDSKLSPIFRDDTAISKFPLLIIVLPIVFLVLFITVLCVILSEWRQKNNS